MLITFVQNLVDCLMQDIDDIMKDAWNAFVISGNQIKSNYQKKNLKKKEAHVPILTEKKLNMINKLFNH